MSENKYRGTRYVGKNESICFIYLIFVLPVHHSTGYLYHTCFTFYIYIHVTCQIIVFEMFFDFDITPHIFDEQSRPPLRRTQLLRSIAIGTWATTQEWNHRSKSNADGKEERKHSLSFGGGLKQQALSSHVRQFP